MYVLGHLIALALFIGGLKSHGDIRDGLMVAALACWLFTLYVDSGEKSR